jgi:membrane protein implicated in regulation of membrane protease activity
MRSAREGLLFACGGAGLIAASHLVFDWTGSWRAASIVGAVCGFSLFLTWALDRTARRLDAQEDRVEDRLEALEERAQKVERLLLSLDARDNLAGATSGDEPAIARAGGSQLVH